MNRKLLLVASLLFAMAAFAFGPEASAQDTCCAGVRNTTNCPIILCVRTASGAIRCDTIAAHDSAAYRFLCNDSTAFGIYNACGQLRRLRPNDCIRVVLRGDCCARACLRRGDDGCFHILVAPIDGPCDCQSDELD